MKKAFLVIIVFLSVFCSRGVLRADVSKTFVEANDAYERGDYKKARELYKSILEERRNGDIYYNLGNSCFKEGDIGKALVNYLRARKYSPSDNDINDNLTYLRTLTKDKIEDKSPFNFIYKIFFYYDTINLKEFIVIVMIFNTLFFSILTISLFSDRAFLRWLKQITLLLLILVSVGAVLNYKAFVYDEKGVIVGSEVSVRSGGSVNDTVLFNLHEGTEFNIIDENHDSIKIELPDKKRGWVMKKVIERV